MKKRGLGVLGILVVAIVVTIAGGLMLPGADENPLLAPLLKSSDAGTGLSKSLQQPYYCRYYWMGQAGGCGPAGGGCTNECSPSGSTQCSGNGVQTCGNLHKDTCLEWSPNAQFCPNGCEGGVCLPGGRLT